MSSWYFTQAPLVNDYGKYRPRHPATIMDRILKFLKEKYHHPLTQAVDVGCGTGISTAILAPHFQRVVACDVSAQMIEKAKEMNSFKNVSFCVSAAEDLPVASQSVQLVTVGSALHWFDLHKFYEEVERILVPGGVLAVYAPEYPTPIHKDPSVTAALSRLFHKLLFLDTDGCWSEAVMMKRAGYKDIDFPFQEHLNIRDGSLYYEKKVSLAEYLQEIQTFSGLQQYKRDYGEKGLQNCLQHFTDEFLYITGTTCPKEMVITTRYNYILMMGRKQLS